MSLATGDGPTAATIHLDLPCHPLREDGGAASIDVADVRRADDGYVAIVRMSADDASAVADSLTEWDQVSGVNVLSAAGESRLLRLELAEETPVIAAYEALVERDVLLSACIGTADGWEVRLTAPSHAALAAVYDRWRGLGMNLHIVSVSGEASDGRPADGLTDSQREALLRAAEAGYFSVPRQTTLGEVAEGLSVSDQAVSERIRRGIHRLVRDSVETDDAAAAAPERKPVPPRDGSDGRGDE